MTLSSLLVCVDAAAAGVLRSVLEELKIKVESCPDLARAAIRLAQQRFDVVIIDCDSQSEVNTLLRETRHSRVNDSTLAVAVVSGQERIREMFSLGVNFVLYKPVSYERALSSLRAARAVMRKEKRRNARTTVHAHATVDYANVEQEKATLMDLAQDGMSVLLGKKLPPTNKVYFQFQLPGQKSIVRLSGQVMWQDWNGRAGIQFVDVPKASRRLLTDYLSSNPPQASKDFADVTVELEDPVPFGAGPQKGGDSARASNGEAAEYFLPDPDDRRTQARYACRLGAEVYRTGTQVPNYCCLTDLSPGGCYLEMPLPFPKDASVEITVRTHQLKLQLRGTILTSHPGYGMGVRFDLNTRNERDQVQKLTDFVASTAEASN